MQGQTSCVLAPTRQRTSTILAHHRNAEHGQGGSVDVIDDRQIWELTKHSVDAWIDDYAPSMGAALAYYTLFAIAPLLLIIIAAAGVFFGADAARGQIVA